MHANAEPATSSTARRFSYTRREPDKTTLYCILQRHLETFLSLARDADEHGVGLPRFVERELRGFLKCGILAHGFARFRCQDCGLDRLVALSCKGRGYAE